MVFKNSSFYRETMVAGSSEIVQSCSFFVGRSSVLHGENPYAAFGGSLSNRDPEGISEPGFPLQRALKQ
jgi:hypothetical protein